MRCTWRIDLFCCALCCHDLYCLLPPLMIPMIRNVHTNLDPVSLPHTHTTTEIPRKNHERMNVESLCFAISGCFHVLIVQSASSLSHSSQMSTSSSARRHTTNSTSNGDRNRKTTTTRAPPVSVKRVPSTRAAVFVVVLVGAVNSSFQKLSRVGRRRQCAP